MSQMSNPLATVDQLYRRNNLSLLPQDLRDTIFFATQCLTQAAGLLLRLPQSVTAQANVVLARYMLSDEWPPSSEFSDLSAATLFLVAKLSAHPCMPRDISNVYAYLVSAESRLFRRARGGAAGDDGPRRHDASAYHVTETEYVAFHDRVLALEGRILYALSFDTHVALPHPLAITYLQALDFLHQAKAAIGLRVVEYLNTALLSPQLLYLTHQPNALAVAAIYSAARDVGAKMPECAWWEVFDVEREELGFLVVAMRSVDGWFRKTRDEVELLDNGMVTRRDIDDILRRRGLSAAGGDLLAEQTEEEAMMRCLDEKAAQLQA